MIQDMWQFEMTPALGPPRGNGAAGNQQADPSIREVFGHADADLQGADRDELIQRLAPGVLIGQIDEMEDEAAGLFVQMTVDETCAFDGERDISVSGPANEVAQEITVVGEVGAAILAVDIGG